MNEISSQPDDCVGETVKRAIPFYKEHCIYLPAMLGWFACSAALSTYNKVIFGSKHMHFPCPLLMTSIHFGTQWVFSIIACAMAPETVGASRIQRMSWTEWICISIPCGVVTSGDVGLSNLSLVRISLTFYTMVKASTPIFVLAWAYLFGIERITLPLIGVILIIAFGEFLTVYGEVDFDHTGFVLCVTASVLSGARWTLVQLKLRSLDPPLKTTVATMRVLAPSMFWSLFVFSLLIEHPWTILADYTLSQLVVVVGWGLGGALIAIAMILCEFYLIMHANAFILMIGGVIKEMVTIGIGILFFHDAINRVNESGCFVVFIGVGCYKLLHYIESQRDRLDLSARDPDDPNKEADGVLRPRSVQQYGGQSTGEDASLLRVTATAAESIELSSLDRNAVNT